jgi:hypothetical protein
MSATYHDVQHSNPTTLTFALEHYTGGVAIWGALPAVFDNTDEGFDRGVHVHARYDYSRKKVIDQTYAKVEIHTDKKSFIITESAAVSFTMSSIFDIQIVELICPVCRTSHLDTGFDAVIPHQKHQCHTCGYIMLSDVPVVSNHLITLKRAIGDETIKRESLQPDRSITLDPEKFSGGFQIWGSNPSIVWTAKRLEESAIHVHAMSRDGQRVIDNTYSHVEVEGEKLDIEMIRVLQIQRALDTLPLSTVRCPYCNTAQFDRELNAVIPRSERKCECCFAQFFSDAVVSNPAFSQLKQLQKKLIPTYSIQDMCTGNVV